MVLFTFTGPIIASPRLASPKIDVGETKSKGYLLRRLK